MDTDTGQTAQTAGFASGTAPAGNGSDGILLTATSGSTISSNVISGNGAAGVYLDTASAGNVVRANFIGTDLTGGAVIGNLLDGVVLDYRVLPGAANWEFDLGYTAVHEVGHWIGLLHTFQGGGALSQARVDGCFPPGDEVADTDYERGPYFGPGSGNQCLAPMASSCPTGGFNPIRNFMDYADDRCMSELTTGQDIRARSMMQAYRGSFVESSPDVLRFERMREQQ